MNSTTEAPDNLPPGFQVVRHKDPKWNTNPESLLNINYDTPTQMNSSPRRRGTADSSVPVGTHIEPDISSQQQTIPAQQMLQSITDPIQQNTGGSTVEIVNSNTLAKRPNYWRPDYVTRPRLGQYLRMISWKRPIYDTVQCNLHLMLKYRKRCPPFWFDLRDPIFAPSAIYVHVSLARCDIDQLALSPPCRSMRIFHPRLPWYIDVFTFNRHGITLFDVFYDIHEYMQTPILHRDFYTEEIGEEERFFISAAFRQRFQTFKESEKIMSQGVKRIDYLGEEYILEGLVKRRDGLWELKTRRPDKIRAPNTA